MTHPDEFSPKEIALDAELREILGPLIPENDLEDRVISYYRQASWWQNWLGGRSSAAAGPTPRAAGAAPVLHPAVRKSATAAAALLLVGAVGYYGSHAISGTNPQRAMGPAVLESAAVNYGPASEKAAIRSETALPTLQASPDKDDINVLNTLPAQSAPPQQGVNGPLSNDVAWSTKISAATAGLPEERDRDWGRDQHQHHVQNSSVNHRQADTGGTGGRAFYYNAGPDGDLSKSGDDLYRFGADGRRETGLLSRSDPSQPPSGAAKPTYDHWDSVLLPIANDGPTDQRAPKSLPADTTVLPSAGGKVEYFNRAGDTAGPINGGKSIPLLHGATRGRPPLVAVPTASPALNGPSQAGGQDITGTAIAGPVKVDKSPIAGGDVFSPDGTREAGTPPAGGDNRKQQLNWVSTVGNAAVPGSIVADPGKDAPQNPPTAGGGGQTSGEHTDGTAAQNPVTAGATTGASTGVDPQHPAATAPAVDARKIIRSGSMEFEVDRFDTAQMQITKIVTELGGYIGATDSAKLPNGKMHGTISVRIAPERLDVLVLSLRALGDLKSQQITAQDITREYTDIESELAADRAMQDRLLDLIHSGKGSIKDLLAAENELGSWRTKVEKAQGQINYFNNLVALSTLSITISERDLQTPASIVETQTADMGIETDDVEKARNTALKLVDDIKGRVIEAELKNLDAGQLAARLVVDVPPQSTGAVIDQLKLIGKVARLEMHRQTTGDTLQPTAVPHTQINPSRLTISIYNLANVAPRQTTTLSLAATDVESAFNALLAIGHDTNSRVVTSNLDRGSAVTATGAITLEIPPAKLQAALAVIRAQGEVLKLNVLENPDTQNSTDAKQGISVQLVSLASTPARESVEQILAAVDVPTAYQQVMRAIGDSGSRVLAAKLNEEVRQNITAEIDLEVPRVQADALDKALAGSGDSISRTSTRSDGNQGAEDSKIHLRLAIVPAERLAPRESTRLTIEVADAAKATADAQTMVIGLGGKVLDASVNRDNGKETAHVQLDIPLDKTGEVLRQLRDLGAVRSIDSSRDQQAPAGKLAHAHYEIDFATPDTIVADQTGPWAAVRQGLTTSVTGLLWSLQWIVVGLCLIGPWAGIAWIIRRFWKGRKRPAAAV